MDRVRAGWEKLKAWLNPIGGRLEAVLRQVLRVSPDLALHKSLSYKLSVFSVVAVVLPAVTVALSLILIGRHALTESIYQTQSETALRIADRVSLHVDHVRSVLSIAANEPGLASFPKSRKEQSLKHLLRWQETFKEAYTLDAFGQESAKLASVDNTFVPARAFMNRRNRPEFTDPMLSGKPYIGEPFFWGDRLPYLLASCPMYGRRGVLAVRVSLANLWDLVKEVRAGQPGEVYILDARGNLIAHPDKEQVLSHASLAGSKVMDLFKRGRTGRESFGVRRNLRGEKVVSLVQTVPGLGWGVVMEIPVAQAYAPIRRMQDEVIKWTFICVVVILGFALWRIQGIVGPLEALEEGARKISHGQLALELDVHTGDELERLAQSFGKMAVALKELEELRHDLISMIVHDLKSPLSGIMGGLDYALMAKSPEQMENVHKVLALSRKSAEDLHQMVQNLLDVAKMEEGKLELHRETAPLPALLDECAELFQVQVEKESKKILKDYEPNLPAPSMDTHLIRRLLANLVSNAIRHTQSEGVITLRARLAGDFLEAVVEDNGEGIQPEYRDKIFDKFVQAQRKRAHVRSGTGLGLTFCKMAVELHGGRISVDSVVGKGSAFKFTLPLSKTPEPRPEVSAT